MINSRLAILSPLTSDYVNIPITKEIPVENTYAIADIREPDKRNSAWSKTIIIPGTHEVNKLFELIFEINITLSAFNPNLKTKSEYWVGNEKVFKGNLQILNINVKYIGETLEVEYECSIVGEANDLIIAFGDKMLTDIDLSSWNHPFTPAYLTTFPAVVGTGPAYSHIDYGIIGASIGPVWTWENFKPGVFEREYLVRMFAAAGKTWTSTFLDSAYYKSIFIPCVNEGNLKASQATIDNAEFYAGKTVDTTTTIAGANLGSGNWFFGAINLNFAQGVFDDESSNPFFDPGGVYNNGTNIFAPNYQGIYQVVTKIDFTVLVNPPAGTFSYTILAGDFDFKVNIENGAMIGTGSGSVTPNIATPTAFSIVVTIPSTNLIVGDNLDVQLYKDNDLFTINFKDNVGANINVGTSSVIIKQKSSSTFYALLASDDLTYGSTVIMNDTIPRNVRQKDFFMGIVQSENLYIEQDKNNPNNYIIEPRESFIQYTNPLDWTAKLDISKKRQVIPMGDLNFKRLLYSYKSDKDEYNQEYENIFKETYSTKTLTINNEFVKNDKKTELIFAATPVVGNNYNDIVCPKIYSNNNGTIKPMAATIRRLIWKGTTNCQPYTMMINGGTYNYSTYNFAGMMNDPYNPTVTLDWDNPLKLFYIYPGITYTDNGLYNRGYSKLISEITDKDSKIVKAWFNLTERDISTFSFRKIVYVDGTYYFVNQIMSYNPNERKSTLVELLKLKKGAVFAGIQFGFELAQAGGFSYPGNYGNVLGGQNNINLGQNCLILGGVNNYIGNG